MKTSRERVQAFCARFGLRTPILMAPMAGASPVELAVAVANGGGMGACGALRLSPQQIEAWAASFRAGSQGPFQINTWIPDSAPERDPAREAALRAFLGQFGPPVDPTATEREMPDFDAQCQAMLAARPTAISSVMGLYSPAFVQQMKDQQIAWFATVTTVRDALAAVQAGADALIVQGAGAGGHRGSFDPDDAPRELTGLFGLLPAISNRVDVPIVASGAIADGRGIAAALTLGASAVSVGSVFLRCHESPIPDAWKHALASTMPEDTVVTRVFSGRAARALGNDYVSAASAPDAPKPAPYPIQGMLTAAMSMSARKANDMRAMYALGGESSALARAEPAADTVRRLWEEAKGMLG